MNNVTVTIWGRQLELPVTFDCYQGEEILQSQIDSVNEFSKAEKAIDSALEAVKEYCIGVNPDEIEERPIDNIFKLVAPKYLYVPREKDKHIVAIMCNYKFDQEDGIAIVFENLIFSQIGKQDIIL